MTLALAVYRRWQEFVKAIMNIKNAIDSKSKSIEFCVFPHCVKSEFYFGFCVALFVSCYSPSIYFVIFVKVNHILISKSEFDLILRR